MIRFFFIVLVLFCSPKKNEITELENFLSKQNYTNEELALKVSKTILKNKLKTFEFLDDSVYINFGSNIAYTFKSESNYSESIQFEIVQFILNFYYFTKQKKINEIRVSYSKPFYAELEGKETLSEYEIFRVKLDFSDLKKIKNIEKLKFLSDEKKMNSNLREIFNQVRLVWKVEMDEIKRVQLK